MRYLPLSNANRTEMLAAVGVQSMDDLFTEIPKAAREAARFDLPNTQGELEVERHMAALAAKNVAMSAAPSFLGCGNYRHHTPAALDYIIHRGEFLTAYTPYQP